MAHSAPSRPAPLRATVRWLTRSDHPAVLAVESALPAPVGPASLLARVRRRDTIAFVAVDTLRRVCGHLLCRVPAAGRHVEVLRLAVRPDVRRRGVGGRLLAHAAEVARKNGRPALGLWAPEPALDLHLFLRARGAVAVRCGPRGYRFTLTVPET